MKGARFPRATAKRVILEGDVYNDIVTRLERAENLSVGAGLTLYDEPAGKVIAADAVGPVDLPLSGDDHRGRAGYGAGAAV
jgi:hypothetical protein